MPESGAVPSEASVLVVDDDPRWLRAMRRWLQTLGVEYIHCAHGQDEACQWLDDARRRPRCIVLTDMRMHGDPHAGLAVVARAKRAGAPVAVLSASVLGERAKELAGVPVTDKQTLTREVLFELLVRLEMKWRRRGLKLRDRF